MRVLVTGAAGYIGSHSVIELLNAGFEVCAVDDLSSGRMDALRRAEELSRRRVDFIREDVRNRSSIARVLSSFKCEAIIHFAGLKSVPQSIEAPLVYYEVNVGGALALLSAMQETGVRRLVFSSSAAVYGDAKEVPIPESAPLAPRNPYGWTKLMAERLLHDIAASDSRWEITSLRYFNPVGAHPSGALGEIITPQSSNLAPQLAQVALGRLPHLRVFGNDYPTPDGSAVRDFIHVMDIASAHVQALKALGPGARVYNLGSGTGHSIKQMILAFERASGRQIPTLACARRPGDVSTSYANADLAERELGWRAVRTIEQMCEDAWRWHAAHPEGLL